MDMRGHILLDINIQNDYRCVVSALRILSIHYITFSANSELTTEQQTTYQSSPSHIRIHAARIQGCISNWLPFMPSADLVRQLPSFLNHHSTIRHERRTFPKRCAYDRDGTSSE